MSATDVADRSPCSSPSASALRPLLVPTWQLPILGAWELARGEISPGHSVAGCGDDVAKRVSHDLDFQT